MSRGERLLVVDDDVQLGRLLMHLAEAVGLSTMVLSDGSRVVDFAADQQPDIILLDLGLPRIDGRDVLRALKTHPRTFHIPVFVHTGALSHSDRLAMLELGADDYFEKPFDCAMLIRRIQHRLLKLRSVGESGPPSDVDRRSSEKLRIERQVRLSQGHIRVTPSRPDRPVLVVEDDKDLRECICDILEDEGIDAWPARNGQEALDLLGRHSLRPSLILLDLVMPVVDGREFHARLSLEVSIPPTPVVLMSEFEPDAALQSLPWLQKPLNLGELLATVSETRG